MIAFKGPDGDLLAHDSRRIDEELIRGDKPMSKSIPSGSVSPQIVCDRLPSRSGAEGKDEVSRGMFSKEYFRRYYERGTGKLGSQHGRCRGIDRSENGSGLSTNDSS